MRRAGCWNVKKKVEREEGRGRAKEKERMKERKKVCS
jgi:hypothetical protein